MIKDTKVITITKQKGGTGKTTTAAAVAAGLILKGYKVLSIDLDAQCNLSYSQKAEMGKKTILGVLIGEVDIAEAIQSTPQGDIIPSTKALAGADAFIIGTGKEYRLKEALRPLMGKYDFVIIDTPPALGILTVNALTASSRVIIPIQADIYSLHGVGQLNETILPVKQYCNPDLHIEGLLLTRFSPRSVLSREIIDIASNLAENLNTKLFESKIREGIAIKEAQLIRKSIFSYAPKSNPACDYDSFVNELLENWRENDEKENIHG